MKSSNPFPAPTRTSQTTETYLKEGERHLRRAKRLFSQIACPAKALVAVRETEQVLKARTARRYWQEHLAILGKLQKSGEISGEAHDEAKAAIATALFDARKCPLMPQTGAKKVRDLSEAEAATVIEALAQKAQATKADGIDRYLLLYTRLAPVLGFRPCEGIGIRLSGLTLHLPCAKNSNGRAGRDMRPVNLKAYEPGFLELVAQFITVQQALIDAYGGFDQFYPAARQRLARLSLRVVQRRVCPYSFRHVAMATWKAAGYDAATIALLAGHSSKTTAGKHYAGKRHGWPVAFAVAVPAEAPAAAEDDAMTPTNIETLVEAMRVTEADAPNTDGPEALLSLNEADRQAAKSPVRQALFDIPSPAAKQRRPAGKAQLDQRRAQEHADACPGAKPPRHNPNLMDIPAYTDPEEQDLADGSEETDHLGMRF